MVKIISVKDGTVVLTIAQNSKKDNIIIDKKLNTKEADKLLKYLEEDLLEGDMYFPIDVIFDDDIILTEMRTIPKGSDVYMKQLQFEVDKKLPFGYFAKEFD
jgi:hypothetical protein